MVGYVWWAGRKQGGEMNQMMRWRVGIGLMKEVCRGGVGPLLQLAVPSYLGMCLEWWWYEIVTVMAGYSVIKQR
jgi:MATE family multidrug resistance protein